MQSGLKNFRGSSKLRIFMKKLKFIYICRKTKKKDSRCLSNWLNYTWFGWSESHLQCRLVFPDFPVVEPWSESAALSESSVFMDGFLYVSSASAKATLDRRGRDGKRECRFAKFSQKGQSHGESISKQFKLRVCQRSPPVKHWSINQCQSVSRQTASRLIRTTNSPVKGINGSVFQKHSGLRGKLVRHMYVRWMSFERCGKSQGTFRVRWGRQR